MPSDFIDRAKLEALADEHSRGDDIWPVRRARRKADFLAGAAAYAAILDAETTEEWGVQHERDPDPRFVVPHVTKGSATYGVEMGERVVHRRVTPWLPSEGGEKP